jgi:large subunit ribosomal protein L30e
MDWNRFNQEFRNVIDTGSIIYGTKNSKRACFIGEPKLLVVSKTLTPHIKEEFIYFAKLLNIQIINYPESSIELGSVCGKPFSISVVAMTDFGKSSIVDVIESKENTTSKVNSKVVSKKLKKETKDKIKKEKIAKIAAKKAEREIIDKVKQEEETKEIPIREDAMFKDIIKIKKK